MTSYTHTTPAPALHADLVELAQRLGCTAADLMDIMVGDQSGTDYTDESGHLTADGADTLATQIGADDAGER